MNGKVFFLCDGFLVFVVFNSVLLRRLSKKLDFLANLGNGILVNLVLSFPNSVTFRNCFLQ